MDRGGNTMLLQTIKLENFRQFRSGKINFSTDPDRNVTMIIGENGTGKTSFAQAFFWVLYGETSFVDKSLLNKEVAKELVPGEINTVKVILNLIHGSAQYEISRKQDYQKKNDNKLVPSNSILNVAIRLEDGNTRYLKPLECEAEIKKILPKELSRYFFFDGERIEQMSKEIASGKKSSSFASAVTGLMGLQAIQKSCEHLSPSKINSVFRKFDNEYKDDSNSRIEQLTKLINNWQTLLTEMETRLSDIDDEIAIIKSSTDQLKDSLRKFDESKKLQEDRDNYEKQLKSAKKVKAELVKTLFRNFNEGSVNFISKSLVSNALLVLSHTELSGKNIPEMDSKTINFLLDRGECICGTRLDVGTIPYLKVKELYEYLPPQHIGTTVGNFVTTCQNKYSNNRNLLESVNERLASISLQTETIDELDEKISRITEALSGEDVREQVRKINQQIQTYNMTLRKDEKEKEDILKNIGKTVEQKKNAENERHQLTLTDKHNRFVEICKTYTELIYEELNAEYQNRETEVRNRLEFLINEIFKSIYNGGLSISIDEKYNISVNVLNYDGEVETSTAQSISVIFAFITAIIKMARENQKENENNGEEKGYSEPYPLVMDAPLSAFDKRRIEAICKTIPETAEQVIIFIKDTDGDLAEQHLGYKINVRHFLKKNNEFNTELL